MPTSKMSLLSAATALIATFAPGAYAVVPYSDSKYTSTADPQEIGSVTSKGMLVYSMNYCTIFHNTECQVSMFTGGRAPSSESTIATAAADETKIYTPVPTVTTNVLISSNTATENASGSSQSTQAGVPVSEGQPTVTVISTHDESGYPTFMTSSILAITGTVVSTGTVLSSAGTITTYEDVGSTATEKSDATGTSAAPLESSSTGGSSNIKVLPAIMLGAAGFVVAAGLL